MISRAQRILFAVMLIAVVTMAAILIRLRERAQDRLHSVQDSTPVIEESAASAPQTVTLVIPNDLDGSLAETRRNLALPADDSTKARVLLESLIESFRDPHSTHPIGSPANPSEETAALNPEGSAGVDEVYLMPVPQNSASANGGMLAVVDFSAAFASSHPSGIEPESLTLLAVLGTLHANIPAITQVRFLIDGHPAETLAGHAGLTRTYLTADITTGIQQP
jgi:hypothetical protein